MFRIQKGILKFDNDDLNHILRAVAEGYSEVEAFKNQFKFYGICKNDIWDIQLNENQKENLIYLMLYNKIKPIKFKLNKELTIDFPETDVEYALYVDKNGYSKVKWIDLFGIKETMYSTIEIEEYFQNGDWIKIS